VLEVIASSRTEDEEASSGVAPVPVAKKRGRPPKSATQPSTSSGIVSSPTLSQPTFSNNLI
jgi:hypothetical protein